MIMICTAVAIAAFIAIVAGVRAIRAYKRHVAEEAIRQENHEKLMKMIRAGDTTIRRTTRVKRDGKIRVYVPRRTD